LDEALSLARSQPWSAGRLIALACGTGLVLVTGLIARQIWPGRPRLAIAAGAFAAAYPVVYRMSILFHPEVLFALLCALALLALAGAARLGWPSRLGWRLGAACGAAALTRQPALLVIACVGAVGMIAGGRAARGFLVRAAVVTAILAVPWWAYAYHRWHNPIRSNLAPRSSLMMDRQPRSFYVSFPFPALVTDPYRPNFDDELLPKLHAELWSDWFGAIHPWQSPSRVDRVTASTQSVLGFVADALATGGLAALAIPAALRLVRRRARAPGDFGLGLLAIVAVAALAAFTITLIRFPQRYGDPIKSSYLLFTTPCWAAFSVAAWQGVRRRVPRLGALLAAVAVLYVASYAADLEGALAHATGPRILGGLAGFVDLNTTFQQTSPTPGLGGEMDFLAGVANTGNQGAGGVVLTVKLPPGMKLLGPPAYEQGQGCTGTSTITCRLDGVSGGGAARIRFGVLVTRAGPQTMTATVASEAVDVNPADNSASFTVDLS
jgi:4-amino-4-deoxy-L-arabinose transferase-like glycosyltransferase